MDIDTSNSLLHLFYNANWRAVNHDDKKREEFHQQITSIHSRDKNTINTHDSNNHSYTPLHIAISKHDWLHYSTLELLLSLGADVTQIDSSGCTPLEVLCFVFHDFSPNTILLIEHEAKDPTIMEKNKQKQGRNPLHWLMQRRDINGNVIVPNTRATLINNLMQAGYNIYAKDQQGFTPVDYFLSFCNYRIESEEEKMWWFLSKNVQLFLAAAKQKRVQLAGLIY
jgi:ankyrin repeat protein